MSITFATAFADLGKLFAAFCNANGYAGANAPLGAYKFTTSAITTAPTAGATYTNNGVTFTVLQTMGAAGTVMVASGNSAPATSGTLTKASGTGDATVTYSAFSSFSNWGTAGPVIKSQATMYAEFLAILNESGLTSLIPTAQSLAAYQQLDQALSSQKQANVQDASSVLIQRVNNDVPQTNPTSLELALIEWIRQMQAASSTVQQCTVSSSVVAGAGNTGNATPYAALYDANGLLLEYSVAEAIILRCTQDQYTGAVAGSEIVSVVAPAAASNNLSYLWPGGSGLNTTLQVVDPTQGYGNGGNLIGGGSSSVGAFKAWTAAVPNGWTIDVDGANIADGTSAAYAGLAHCLKLIGNTLGTNLNTALYQTFANGGISGGSTVTLAPNTVYLFQVHVKADVVPAAGAITISLTDGSGTVINNNAGTPNSIVISISGLGNTNYNTFSGAFQTPTVMPTNARIRIKVTTPITSASNVYLDFAGMSQPSTGGYGGLYAGGPFMSIFRGAVDLVRWVSPTIGDTWTDTIANNMGSSSPTPLSLQWLFQQFFNMSSLGLVLPSALSPTVPNSVIS